MEQANINQPAHIEVKSVFSGWHVKTEAEAREWAKYKLRAITTGKSDEERLVMVNAKIRGIQFTLADLKGK